MKSKLLLSCIGATALLATSCVSDDVVQNNPDPKGNALTFVPSVGSRAVETTLVNLGDIGIFAQALHDNYSFYDNFLIGSKSGATALPEIAKRTSLDETAGTGKWELDHKVYWPTGVKDVLFWGVTTLRTGATKGALATDKYVMGENENSSFSFGKVGPQNELGMVLTGFSPKRAETRTGTYSDGELQQDLVIATTAQSTQSSFISLSFKHKLAQIQILATRGQKDDNDHRVVKVKGAWIVNVEPTGDFKSYFKHDETGDIHFTHELDPKENEWESKGTHVAYGSLLDNAYTLKNDEPTILLDNKPGNLSEHGSLMLIPQTQPKWDGGQSNVGAYILLYCRVELKHKGENHDGSTDTSDKNVFSDGEFHYHQVFPKGDWNSTAYGYTCVPIEINWEAGKRYTYTLTICGPSSGAGVYPPQRDDSEFPDYKTINEKIGKAVLDAEISFSVSVSPWVDDGTWKPGGTDVKPE